MPAVIEDRASRTRMVDPALDPAWGSKHGARCAWLIPTKKPLGTIGFPSGNVMQAAIAVATTHSQQLCRELNSSKTLVAAD